MMMDETRPLFTAIFKRAIILYTSGETWSRFLFWDARVQAQRDENLAATVGVGANGSAFERIPWGQTSPSPAIHDLS